MKIVKSELIKRINMLEKCIPVKPTIPCMGGILVHAGRMCANDLQNAISIATPEAEGEHFILPQKAVSMAKNLPDGLIDISAQGDNSIVIKAGTIRTKMTSFAPDEFSEPRVLEDAAETELAFGDLYDMLSNVSYAASVNASRPVQTGILLGGDGTDLNVVACDGFRCAWAHTGYTEDCTMVIPKPTVKLLLSIKGGERISIQTKGKKAVFKVGDFEIYSNLLSGSFMDYKRVYPVRSNSIGVDRGNLLDALRRLMICSDDTHKAKVEINGSGKSLKIKSSGMSAEYVEELECQDSFEQELRIMFNGAYLIDALKSYDALTVDLFFGQGSTEPLVIDDGKLKTLVLPVRMK